MGRPSIRLLDVRPELGRDLADGDFRVAQRAMVLPAAVLEPGPIDPERLAVAAASGGPLVGAVVTAGLVTSEVRVDGRRSVSLHGPGDLLLLDGVPPTLPANAYTFRAVRRSTVGLLDERFVAQQEGWPAVTARLVAEAGRRTGFGHHGQDGDLLEQRLFDVLCSAAARWGWRDGQDVALDLPLTSELLARVVGGRSATVALGLRELCDHGLVGRRAGTWVLPHGAVVARADVLAARFPRDAGVDGAIAEALEGTMAFLGADFGNVQIFDPGDEVLRITVQRGFDQDFLDHFAEVHAGDGAPCGTTMGAGRPVVVPDVYRDETFAPHLEIAEATGIRAIHSTPLVDSAGQLQGMLSTHYRDVHHPAPARLSLVSAQARLLADGLSRVAAEG